MFNFRGIAPPIVTPFDDSGEIEENSLRELIDWWIDNGVAAIVPCGSNGEVAYMTPEERVEVVEITVDHVGGRVPVIAGTGYPSTHQTITMTEKAKRIGADAALVVTPYYYPVSEEGMTEHYERLADSVDMPILLYNVPKFTHCNITPQAVSSLSSVDNIVGIKESSGNLGLVQNILMEAENPDFDLYAGTGGLFSTILHAGGRGGILALANIAPKRCAQIYDQHSKGNTEKAQEMNYDLVELNTAITQRYAVPGLKYALNRRGLPAGSPRPPFQEVGPKEKEEIERILSEADL